MQKSLPHFGASNTLGFFVYPCLLCGICVWGSFGAIYANTKKRRQKSTFVFLSNHNDSEVSNKKQSFKF